MQSTFAPRRCVWCNRLVDLTNPLEVAYDTCGDCLIPLPTE
ncbi:MAG TPA: hypothetical protein VKF15_01025 [Nitrososphaerales archaeon]|nr:hypothetical protein [Nitrososphaerales archaeon]